MDWSYIAGLFDGEGSFAIALRNSEKDNRSLTIGISGHISGDEKHLELVKAFLVKEGMSIYYGKVKNRSNNGFKSHAVYTIAWSSYPSMRIFLDKIYGFIVLKKPQTQIMIEAVGLHDKAVLSKSKILHHLDEFDELRHGLHLLAKKGNKNLKPWPKSK